MIDLFWKVVVAILVGIAIWVACTFVGGLLVTIGLPVIDYIGGFLVSWAWILAALAGAWYFVRGPVPPWR